MARAKKGSAPPAMDTAPKRRGRKPANTLVMPAGATAGIAGAAGAVSTPALEILEKEVQPVMSITTTRRARAPMSDDAKARRKAVSALKAKIFEEANLAKRLAEAGLAKTAKARAPRVKKSELKRRARVIEKLNAEEAEFDEAIRKIQEEGGYYTPKMVKYLRQRGIDEADIAMFKAPRKARGAVPFSKRNIDYGLATPAEARGESEGAYVKRKLIEGYYDEIAEHRDKIERAKGEIKDIRDQISTTRKRPNSMYSLDMLTA